MPNMPDENQASKQISEPTGWLNSGLCWCADHISCFTRRHGRPGGKCRLMLLRPSDTSDTSPPHLLSPFSEQKMKECSFPLNDVNV